MSARARLDVCAAQRACASGTSPDASTASRGDACRSSADGDMLRVSREEGLQAALTPRLPIPGLRPLRTGGRCCVPGAPGTLTKKKIPGSQRIFIMIP